MRPADYTYNMPDMKTTTENKKVRCDHCGRIYLVSVEKFRTTIRENRRTFEPNFCGEKCRAESDENARSLAAIYAREGR